MTKTVHKSLPGVQGMVGSRGSDEHLDVGV